MEIVAVIAVFSLVMALLSTLILMSYLYTYPQPMKVMNLVWPLTALWGSLAALWAFFTFGRVRGMIQHPDKHKMQMPERPFWQNVALSTFHCGAGCTVADLVGEGFGPWLFKPFGLAGIGWMWGLDYVLALAFGAAFQYAAIRPGLPSLSPSNVFMRALKIDFLSLTSWQIGMYACSYLIFFILLPRPVAHGSWTFWFVMQLAMAVGFFFSYPVNWWLIKRGVKPAM